MNRRTQQSSTRATVTRATSSRQTQVCLKPYHSDQDFMSHQQLQAVFFDFDGVLVDSNEIKAQAFRSLFSFCDQNTQDRLLAYHRRNGGVSRVVKIQYAYSQLLKQPLSEVQLQTMADQYSALVVDSVISAEPIPGCYEVLDNLVDKAVLFLVSGTPQAELESIITARKMNHYFQKVLGSPTEKKEHIRTVCQKYNLEPSHCLFVGDALTDLTAAQNSGMPFIGIAGETTFPEHVVTLTDCNELLAMLSSTCTLYE